MCSSDLGTYGHPDHVRAHHVAVGACARTGVPLVEIASGGSTDPHIQWREHPGTAEAVHRAVDSYRTQLTVRDTSAEGIAIRHVGGQDDLVALRTGLHVRP